MDDDGSNFQRMMELTFAGRAALSRGHAREALGLLAEKHKLVVEEWGNEGVFSATSAIDLADAFLACGNMAETDRLLAWALEQYDKLGVNDERLLRAKSMWAMSAYQAADYSTAEARFRDLIKHYSDSGAARDIERAEAMDHLAQVYLRQSRNDEADALLLEALAIFERKQPNSPATAVCISLLAQLRFSGQRFREAEQLQRRAIGIHEADGDEINLAKESDHLGATLAMRADSEQRKELAQEAATHGERAVAIFEKYLPADHASLLISKRNLAHYKNLGASIGMMYPHGGESHVLPVTFPDGHPSAIFQLLERSRQRCDEHDYDDALELARDAHRRAIRAFGKHCSLAGEALKQTIGVVRRHCSYLLGESSGTLSSAAFLMMQMRAHARRGIVDDELTPLPQMEPALRAALDKLLKEGLSIVADVTALAPADWSKLLPSDLVAKTRLGSDLLEILHYARWLGVIENRKAICLAFEMMQLNADGSAARGLAMAARQKGADNTQRALHEQYRLAVLERDTLVRSLVEARDAAAASSAAAACAHLPELERKIAELRRQLPSDGAADAGSEWMRLTLDDAQSLLNPYEAILAVHVGSRALFLLAARPSGVVFRRVEMEGDLVRVMCDAVVTSATLRDGEDTPEFDLRIALQIHDLVFHPLEDFLESGLHVLVLPDGPLWTLPFGCLLAEPMMRPAAMADDEGAEVDAQQAAHDARSRRILTFNEWRQGMTARDALSAVSARGAWLADRYHISLMPSFAPLKTRGRATSRLDSRRAFFGMGDPLIAAAPDSGHALVPETRRILSDLAMALGGDPAVDVVVGGAATIDRLLDLSESGELAARRVLCFATHAVYPRGDGDLLTDAGLLFSEGEVLTAFDVAGLRLDADCVLLTACFTGSPAGRSITVPLSGLAQAFLNAGARSLLVSHWRVEVRATELLVREFALAIRSRMPLAGALAGAGKQVRNAGGEYGHPAFWAAFSIIGDGAARL